MRIEFKIKKEFGNLRFYPVTRDAKVLVELMHKKSLTKQQYDTCLRFDWPVRIEYDMPDGSKYYSEDVMENI